MHLTVTAETAEGEGMRRLSPVDLAFTRVLWQLGVEIPDPHRGIPTARGQFRGVRGEGYAQHCLAAVPREYPRCFSHLLTPVSTNSATQGMKPEVTMNSYELYTILNSTAELSLELLPCFFQYFFHALRLI